MNLISASKCFAYFKVFCFMSLFFIIDVIASIIPCLFFVFDFIVPDLVRKNVEDFLMFVSQYPVFPLLFTRHKNIFIYIDKEIDFNSAIIVSNHQSAVDTISMDALLGQFNRISHLRGIFKFSLFHIPFIGIGLYHKGSIPVFRSKHRGNDREFIKICMEETMRYSNDFLMLIYTEGTRRNPKNKKAIESSNKCWRNNGDFEPTEWVMFPKSGGFETIKNTCGSNLKNILDVTIIYKGHKSDNSDPDKFIAPSLLEYLDNPNINIHIILKHYTVDQFENGKLSLETIFQEKNKLIKEFHISGPKSLKYPRIENNFKILFQFLMSNIFLFGSIFTFYYVGIWKLSLFLISLYLLCQVKFIWRYHKYMFNIKN